MSLNSSPFMSLPQRGPCGKVPMPKSVAVEQIIRHRYTTYDKNLHVYYCGECDAFHIGHVRQSRRRELPRDRRKKWKRKRGKRQWHKLEGPSDAYAIHRR